MTSDNLFVRPGLTATSQGIVEPARLVDVWLARVIDLVEGRGTGGVAADAYDLLAGWARLRRCRPELLAVVDPDQDWHTVNQAVEGQRTDLVRQAMGFATPPAWLAEAQDYYEAIDSNRPADELSLWAERLLMDLDDAELVLWAMQPALKNATDDGLGNCHRWLLEHAEVFALCGVHVQAVAATIRPELSALDPDLVRTADKFVLILDALEEAENDLAFTGEGVFEAAERPILRLVDVPRQGRQNRGYSRSILAPEVMAAAKIEPASGPGCKLRWIAPDRPVEAVLVLPSPEVPATGGDQVRLRFLEGGRRALSLVGKTFRLATIFGKVDNTAGFVFALRDLRDADQDIDLEVEGQPWSPEPD